MAAGPGSFQLPTHRPVFPSEIIMCFCFVYVVPVLYLAIALLDWHDAEWQLILLLLYHHPLSLLRSSSARSPNTTGRTDQALLYSLFCQKLPTVRHVLSITAFCVGIYTTWRRLIGVKVCSLCGITQFVDNIKRCSTDRPGSVGSVCSVATYL